MSVFFEALKTTMADERGYVNHPLDRGGETYWGLTRKDNPDWPGWAIVDEYKAKYPGKSHKELTALLEQNEALTKMVEAQYRKNYWFPWMDKVPAALAIECFDAAVNHGPHWAALFLQECLNLLNENGKTAPDIAKDGKPGPATLGALDSITKRRGLDLVLKCYKLIRGEFFLDICRRDPTQEAFLAGWLIKRVRL